MKKRYMDSDNLQVNDIVVDLYNSKRTFRLLALPEKNMFSSVTGLALMRFVKLDEWGNVVYEGETAGYNQLHCFRKYIPPVPNAATRFLNWVDNKERKEQKSL